MAAQLYSESYMPRIAILMATYNGARYLAEQMDAVLAQSYPHWELYVQDDLSTDDTPNILAHYAAADARIHIVSNDRKRGAMRNFERLMATVDAECYMFSDQDDIWLPEKVERTLAFFRQRQEDDSKPLVVCTDLRVVDAHLHELAPSFWKMQRISPQLLTTLPLLGVHCLATGCTMMFNAAARRAALPFPPEAVMHDVWLTLAAARAGGTIAGLPETTILYRQHARNAIGASDETRHYLSGKLRHIRHIIADNVSTYRMLRCIDYGSVFKYLYCKWLYFKLYRRNMHPVSPPTDRKRISVCLASYNGADVIREQLESILQQLSPTDEIIVSDDGSTDGTPDIVRRMGSPVIRIIEGPALRSPTLNFENALREAKGEFIFLSDQDDKWVPEKVAVMLNALKEADCVVSDCFVTDRNLKITADSFYSLNETRPGHFYNLLRKNGYQGCCMAFKRNVLEKSLPFPRKIPLHDIWIGNVAAFCYSVRFIPEKLIYFRRHAHNASVSAEKSHFSFLRKLKFRLDTILPLLRRYFRKGGYKTGL